MTPEALAALLVPCAECGGDPIQVEYGESECPTCHGARYPALLRHLSEQEERLARYSNPWTVEIQNQESLHWQEFAHDAPLTLKQAEERISHHRQEYPEAKLRVVPWLNPDQRQHAAERIKEQEERLTSKDDELARVYRERDHTVLEQEQRIKELERERDQPATTGFLETTNAVTITTCRICGKPKSNPYVILPEICACLDDSTDWCVGLRTIECMLGTLDNADAVEESELIKTVTTKLNNLLKQNAELRDRLARAESDTKRLDWLEHYITSGYKEHKVTAFERGGLDNETLREAIDAAIAKSQPSAEVKS